VNVGILETIDALELSDEQKEKLRQEYTADVDPLKSENDSLKAKDRRSAVEEEVKALGSLGFDEAPGLLKFYRRVLLSGDAEEPGAVLLSDSEMHLSGDAATGAKGKEEISVAGALRKFVELLPRNNEGQLELSDISLTDDHGRPEDGGEPNDEDKTNEARENLGRITGRDLKRTRKRYQRGVVSGAGGDE
jgi:hypothetical protein